MCVCVYSIYIYTHTHTHTYAHTNTHTHTLSYTILPGENGCELLRKAKQKEMVMKINFINRAVSN